MWHDKARHNLCANMLCYVMLVALSGLIKDTEIYWSFDTVR